MRFLITKAAGAAPPPTVMSVSSNTGEDRDNVTTRHIYGYDFVSGCTATIGGVSVGSLSFVNSTELTFTAPARTLANTANTFSYDVVVTNPDTQTGTLANGYTYTWSPYSLANKTCWLRADLGVTDAGGGRVSAWADQSGAGDSNRNVTQGTSGNRPLLISSEATFNNKPVIDFARNAGNKTFLDSGTWSASYDARTMIAIGIPDLDPSEAYRTPFGALTASEQGLYWLNTPDLEGYAGVELFSGVDWTDPSLAMMVCYGDDLGSIFFNSSTAAVGGSIGSIEQTDMKVGAAFGLNSPWDGLLAEIVCTSDVFDSDKRARICYYVGRYGITAS